MKKISACPLGILSLDVVSPKLWGTSKPEIMVRGKTSQQKLLEMCYFHFQTGLEHHWQKDNKCVKTNEVNGIYWFQVLCIVCIYQCLHSLVFLLIP